MRRPIAWMLGAATLAVVRTASAVPPPPSCDDTPCVAVTGVAKAAGERAALPEATVLVMPADAKARPGRVRRIDPLPADPPWLVATKTDEDGRFESPPVPGPRVRVVVVAPGFLRGEHIVAVQPGQAAHAVMFVPPDPSAPFRTVVTAPEPAPTREAPTARLLEREEIRTLPGSQGDPLRALQNLPGVARVPGGLGLLVLRGAPPNQSRVYLGGHAIPRAFHVLSLASVFPADIVDEMTFLPGNFDARYGNATGGLVVLEPRRPRRDGFHGFGEIDLAAAGAMVEGPIKKGSFAVAAQRGYVDAVVGVASRVIERATGEPSSFLLPSYYDYQGILDYPLPVGRIGLRVFGAGDRMRYQSEGSSDGGGFVSGRGDFEYRSDFHRIDVPYTVTTRRTITRFVPSLRFELGRHVLTGDVLRRRRFDVIPALRAETERRIAPGLSLLIGTDLEVASFSVRDDRLVLDSDDPSIMPVRSVTDSRGVETLIGAYATLELRRGPFTLRPGARASAFTVEDQAAFSIDPRAIAMVDLGERWTLSAGLGRYSQIREISDQDTVDLFQQGTGIGGAALQYPPVFARFDPDVRFAPVDTDLTVRQAVQASAGGEVRFWESWSAGLTGFLRDQENGEPVVLAGRQVDVATRSRDAGLEVLLRKRLHGKLYGWLAYTLMFSELRFVQGPDTVRDRPSDFDQRHNLVLLASYALPRRWRIGGRFRVSSGYPYRPVIGSLNVRADFVPIYGDPNSARLPAFHQLDLRVDKSWVLPRASIMGYVDVQNVYNHTNAEALLYSADYRARVDAIGMPIFPSLGVRVDY